MSNLLEGSGISEMASVDGQTYVRVLDEVEEGGLLRTTMEAAWLTESEDRAYPNLPLTVIVRERTAGNLLSEEEMRFLRRYGSDSVSNWFRDAKPGVRVIGDLGYSSELSRERVGNRTVQTIKATAPNTTTWQSMAAGAQSEGSSSINYLPYDGSRYPAYEAMKLFVTEHGIYMATHRPDKLHDHAEQALGWFVLGGPNMHAEVSRQTESAIDRAELEILLPRIGTADWGDGQYEQDEQYLNPARTFLGHIYGRLDELVPSVVDVLCFDPKQGAYRGGLIERIAGAIRAAFAPHTNMPPNSLVQPIETDLSIELAIEAAERFSLLGALASSGASQKV